MLSLMVLSALEQSLSALQQRFDSKKIQRSWYFRCKTRLLQQPLRKAKRLSSAVSISKIENHLSLLFLTALLRVFVSVERDVRDKQPGSIRDLVSIVLVQCVRGQHPILKTCL